ncbi:hypothetical protein K0M31_011199, partial [Melipona bicolor]
MKSARENGNIKENGRNSEVVLEIDEELIYARAQNMLPVVDECRIAVDSDLSSDTQS